MNDFKVNTHGTTDQVKKLPIFFFPVKPWRVIAVLTVMAVVFCFCLLLFSFQDLIFIPKHYRLGLPSYEWNSYNVCACLFSSTALFIYFTNHKIDPF